MDHRTPTRDELAAWQLTHPPMAGGDPEGDPVEPGAVETPPAAPVADTPPNPGPWVADLAEFFTDDTARQAADRWMRERIQPRMTQLETETAPARELWSDITSDPLNTIRDLVEELYDEDTAEKFMGLFGDPEEETPPAPPAEPAEGDIPEWAKPLIERERAQAQAAEREQQEQAYSTALGSLREAHPDLTDDDVGDGTPEKPGLIHPFVHAQDGDMEAAYAAYKVWKDRFAELHGVAPASTERPTAPPVLGGEAAVASTPPVVKRGQSMADAIDEFMAEQRSAPPVVGSV